MHPVFLLQYFPPPSTAVTKTLHHTRNANAMRSQELTMHVSARRTLRGVYVRVGVAPKHSCVRPRPQNASQSPQRDGMVPAESQDELSFGRLFEHRLGESATPGTHRQAMVGVAAGRGRVSSSWGASHVLRVTDKRGGVPVASRAVLGRHCVWRRLRPVRLAITDC